MLQMLRPLYKVRSIRKKKTDTIYTFKASELIMYDTKILENDLPSYQNPMFKIEKKCKEKDPIKMFAMCSTVMIKH
jgi:hypothetical protein